MKISPVNFSLKRYRRRHWTCIPGCGSFKYFFNASKFHRNWGIYFGSFTSFQPRSSKSELFGWVLLISSKIQWVLSFLVSIPTSWISGNPKKKEFLESATHRITLFFFLKSTTLSICRGWRLRSKHTWTILLVLISCEGKLRARNFDCFEFRVTWEEQLFRAFKTPSYTLFF